MLRPPQYIYIYIIFPANGQYETNHCNFALFVGENSNFIQFFFVLVRHVPRGQQCLESACSAVQTVIEQDATPHHIRREIKVLVSTAVPSRRQLHRDQTHGRGHTLFVWPAHLSAVTSPDRFHPTKSNHSLWVKGRTPPLERKRLHQQNAASAKSTGNGIKWNMGGLPLEKKGAEPTEWGDPTGTMAVWANTTMTLCSIFW